MIDYETSKNLTYINLLSINKGLNLISPYVRLSYMMRKPQEPIIAVDYGRKKGHEIFTTIGMGMKRSECDTTLYPQLDHEIQMGAKYMMSSLQLGYLRQCCAP